MGVVQSQQQQASSREEGWAADVQRDNPGWLVVWGEYSRQYTAFPLFPKAPAGIVISNRNPAVLGDCLRQVQERYGFSELDDPFSQDGVS
jgi:hypothetical protein